MEQGARKIGIILIVALLLGTLVALISPLYRETAQAIWRNEPESAPIWRSNESFYPEVSAQEQPREAHGAE